jgi:hypothetical protein
LKQIDRILKAMIKDYMLTVPLKDLANQMVGLSLAQDLSKLFMFMDWFYGELYNTFGTSKSKAWHLVNGVICQFFGDLYAVQGWAKDKPSTFLLTRARQK